jgi:hypothetical protein
MKGTKALTIAILTWIGILATLYSAHGQNIDVLRKRYDTENISRFGSDFRKARQRLSFSDLEREFKPQTVGYDLYRSAARNRTASRILLTGVLASSVAIISFGANRNRSGVFICIGAQMAFTIGSMTLKKRYTEQIDLALAERNRSVLFQ